MILLDSSALVCAVNAETGIDRLKLLLREARLVAVGAPMVLEAKMVLASRYPEARHSIDGFLRDCESEILDFRREHSEVAMRAFLRFGKGRHPAALNFGDCMSYAFAQLSGLTLVYKGEDFGKTDLQLLARLD